MMNMTDEFMEIHPNNKVNMSRYTRSQSTPSLKVLLEDALLYSIPSSSRRKTDPKITLQRSCSSISSNDSHNEILKALQKKNSFTGVQDDQDEFSTPIKRRWTMDSADGDFRNNNVGFMEEKQLQQRRNQCESSLKKLYDERKEHIFELFENTWIISDPLE